VERHFVSHKYDLSTVAYKESVVGSETPNCNVCSLSGVTKALNGTLPTQTGSYHGPFRRIRLFSRYFLDYEQWNDAQLPQATRNVIQARRTISRYHVVSIVKANRKLKDRTGKFTQSEQQTP